MRIKIVTYGEILQQVSEENFDGDRRKEVLRRIYEDNDVIAHHFVKTDTYFVCKDEKVKKVKEAAI